MYTSVLHERIDRTLHMVHGRRLLTARHIPRTLGAWLYSVATSNGGEKPHSRCEQG